MSEELRELYMSNAAQERARYEACLANYRKTDNYRTYQNYVADFIQKKLERDEAKEKEWRPKQDPR